MSDAAHSNSVLRDVRRIARLDFTRWLDLLQAVAWLALARMRLGGRLVGDLIELSNINQAPCLPALSKNVDALLNRVAFAIPSVAARLPWRSDCLVQASAASRWLKRHAIASQLVIGVRAPVADPFEAHAWLKVGDRVVTGGDVSSFVAFAPATTT